MNIKLLLACICWEIKIEKNNSIKFCIYNLLICMEKYSPQPPGKLEKKPPKKPK